MKQLTCFPLGRAICIFTSCLFAAFHDAAADDSKPPAKPISIKEVCKHVSTSMGSNRKRFDTLAGTFRITQVTRTTIGENAMRVGNLAARGEIRFAIDFQKDCLYSDYQDLGQPICTDTKTGKKLPIRIAAAHVVSVVTPEHFLELGDGAIGPLDGFPDVEGVTRDRGGRLAIRDKQEMASPRKLFGKIFDPRLLFGEYPHSIDGLFASYLKAIADPARKPPFLDYLKLEVVKAKAGPLYKLTQRYADTRLPAGQRTRLEFLIDPEQAWHVVQWDRFEKGHLATRRTWEYRRRHDDLRIPSKFTLTIMTPDGKDVAVSRVLELDRLTVNAKLPDEQFELKKLGLKYGERLHDKIVGDLFVMDRDGLVPAEDFELEK